MPATPKKSAPATPKKSAPATEGDTSGLPQFQPDPAPAFVELMDTLEPAQREVIIDEAMRRVNLAVKDVTAELGHGATADSFIDAAGQRFCRLSLDCRSESLGDIIRTAVGRVRDWRTEVWGWATHDLPLRLEITIGEHEWLDRGPKVERAITEALKVSVQGVHLAMYNG